jgi:quercetin dioxygenase-like cupin family protein
MSGFVWWAGEGEAYDWRGAEVTLKVAGPATHDQFAVLESRYPGGLTVPEHVHDGEDEAIYVLDGELSGFCDDEQWVAAAGSLIFVPRDRPHGFRVTSPGVARVLVVIGPPRLDRQVTETGRRLTRR